MHSIAEQLVKLSETITANREHYLLVARLGRGFVGVVRPKGMRQWARKQCYRSAVSLAQRNEGFVYVEGFACGDNGMPLFEHAWLTRDGFHAIDPTLPNAERYSYFGICFHGRTISEMICQEPRYTFLHPTRITSARAVLAAQDDPLGG